MELKGQLVSDVGMGIQLSIMCGVVLLVVSLVGQAAGATPLEVNGAIASTMLAIALATSLVASRLWLVGANLPSAISSSLVYLTPALAAAKIGGLPLVFGMTIFAGLVQVLISPLIGALRKLLTAEIGFVVLTVVGFEIVIRGLLSFVTPKEPISPNQLWIGWGALALMYIMRLVAPSSVNRFAIIIATLLGYMMAYLLGLIPPEARAEIANAPWLALPTIRLATPTFQWNLAVTYAFTAAVATVALVGIVAAVQRAADPNWERPNLRQITRSNAALGCASAISGLFGGIGLAMSSTSASILISARAMRTRIGYFVALTFLAGAFCQKFAALLINIPSVLTSAILIYAGFLLILNGIRFLTISAHHVGIAFTTVVALMFGLSYQVYLPLYEALPTSIRLFTGSGLAVAFITGITLQAFSLIRFRKRVE